MPVMINPAVMAHPDTDAQRANVDAHVVETDASRNGAEVCSNAGTAPTVATCAIYADANPGLFAYPVGPRLYFPAICESRNYFEPSEKFEIAERCGRTPLRRPAAGTNPELTPRSIPPFSDACPIRNCKPTSPLHPLAGTCGSTCRSPWG